MTPLARPIDPQLARQVVASTRWRYVIDEKTKCHIWAGSRTRGNYGQVRFGGSLFRAHRVAKVAALGTDIADPALVIDHLCRRPECVNPDHLEVVTQRENILRGAHPVADQARRTHCPKGHPLSGDNLKPGNLAQGGRTCLTCARRNELDRYALIAQAAAALSLPVRTYQKKFGRSKRTARAVLSAGGAS